MWGGVDSPGRLRALRRRARSRPGERRRGVRSGTELFELGGFYAEYEAFLGDLGRGPDARRPSLREARQSVEVAEQHPRSARSEFRA